MPVGVLRRCSLCKQFHASYIYQDPQLGKLYLCYDCWKQKHSPEANPPVQESPSEEGKGPDTGQKRTEP